jgi:hypothetical protein
VEVATLVFREGEEGNAMDDGQGRSLISFSYPTVATEGINTGTVIKKGTRY